MLAEKWHEIERDKEAVRSLGGLHVVGTERHEARRIDNQLRGRSGRLGDPGSSRFYLSLDDDLMRKFGGERIGGLMERLGVEDDVPIEAGLVNKRHRERADQGRRLQLRHPQARAALRRSRQRAAQPHLRPAAPDPHRAVAASLTVEDMIDAEVGDLVAQFTTGDYEDEWQLDELIQALRGAGPSCAGRSHAGALGEYEARSDRG